MKRRITAMALMACLLAFPAQAEAPNAPFARRAEAFASEKSRQETWAAAREKAESAPKSERGSSFAKRAEAFASARTGTRNETQEEPRGTSKETPRISFTVRAEVVISAQAGAQIETQEESRGESKKTPRTPFASRAEAVASARTGAQIETQEESRGESKKTPRTPFAARAEAAASARTSMQTEAQEESRDESKKTPRTPFAARAEAVASARTGAQIEAQDESRDESKRSSFVKRAEAAASAQVGTRSLAREKTSVVSALEPGTQEAALCEYAERQAEALIAARSADEGMADSLGALDAEMLQRLAAMESAKPDYAALLLPFNGFGREEILDESGCGEEMLPTVAFELVYAANRQHADDVFAAWADRYSLYGVYAGDAPELAYVEQIYGEDLPQTVTVFVRTADGTCLTRTSFVYNPSTYPEEIYMALPALADSFWEGLDTQICALPEE